MRRGIWVCAVGAAAVGGAAWADPIDVTFVGKGPLGHNATVELDGAAGLAFQNGASKLTVWAGQLVHRLDSGPSFLTFCTEIEQWAGSGQYTLTTVPNAPKPGAGMGQAKADALYALYNATGGGQVSTNKQAAAFQALIWLIVYDFDGSDSNTLDLNSGNVKISGIDSSAFNQLKGLVLDSGRDTSMGNLRVLSSPDRQDQLMLIPLPGPAALAGLGLLGVALRRRRSA
jgi:hypothetical protein